MTKIKNSMGILCITEERINELEDRSGEIMQNIVQRWKI